MRTLLVAACLLAIGCAPDPVAQPPSAPPQPAAWNIPPGYTPAHLSAQGPAYVPPYPSGPMSSPPPPLNAPADQHPQAPAISGGNIANASSVVAGMASGFRRCYNKGLAEDSNMQGSVKITAKIGPNGEVLSATPSGGDGLSGTVISCVAARVSSAQFAPPEGGGSTIVIPVTFMMDSVPAPPTPAQSAPPPADARFERAKQIFMVGRQQYEAGHYLEARNMFLAAYQVLPDARILFNVSDAAFLANDLQTACLALQQWKRDARPTPDQLAAVNPRLSQRCP